MHKIVIFAGPSAIGKSFAAQQLMALFPDRFGRVLVYTTRQQRASEAKVRDRMFVFPEQFDDMVKQGHFAVHKHFAGNRYGYHKDDLVATDKHLVVDLPPSFLPDFLDHANITTIGLQAPANYQPLLDTRMQARGDSREVRDKRQAVIKQDIRDLAALHHVIHQHGKVFVVQDDKTIPDQVIPWLIQQLRL
jgi:guanylate kinase